MDVLWLCFPIAACVSVAPNACAQVFSTVSPSSTWTNAIAQGTVIFRMASAGKTEYFAVDCICVISDTLCNMVCGPANTLRIYSSGLHQCYSLSSHTEISALTECDGIFHCLLVFSF